MTSSPTRRAAPGGVKRSFVMVGSLFAGVRLYGPATKAEAEAFATATGGEVTPPRGKRGTWALIAGTPAAGYVIKKMFSSMIEAADRAGDNALLLVLPLDMANVGACLRWMGEAAEKQASPRAGGPVGYVRGTPTKGFRIHGPIADSELSLHPDETLVELAAVAAPGTHMEVKGSPAAGWRVLPRTDAEGLPVYSPPMPKFTFEAVPLG